MLRRVFDLDLRRCGHCGGRLRVIAYLTDPNVTRRILEHLGIPMAVPPAGKTVRAAATATADPGSPRPVSPEHSSLNLAVLLDRPLPPSVGHRCVP